MKTAATTTTCCWPTSRTSPSRFDDFNNWTFGGEWLYGVSNHLETGVSVGYYSRGVPSVYRDVVHDDGREILQELKLKVVPITATIRFLPAGRGAAVEPYIGGGIGIFNWRYTEEGEFVDFSDDSIFERVGADKYKADGTAVGPVIVAGLRFPVAMRSPRASSTSGRRRSAIRTPPQPSCSATKSISVGTRSGSPSISGSEDSAYS